MGELFRVNTFIRIAVKDFLIELSFIQLNQNNHASNLSFK